MSQSLSFGFHLFPSTQKNKNNLKNINESITTIAATSEEISSSVNMVETQMGNLDEQIEVLSTESTKLAELSSGLSDVIEPILFEVEDIAKETRSVIGDITQDPFYRIDD